MIIIEKNTSNTCVFTLNEKMVGSTASWLFEFTHTVTGEVKLFTADDISAYPRFNEFVITDSLSEDEFNGTMNFAIGDHVYKVYQVPTTSPSTLDPADALATVETGLVNVYDPNAEETNYFTEDNTKNSGVFNEED